MTSSNSRATLLYLTAGLAAAGCAAIARSIRRGSTAETDARTREEVVEHTTDGLKRAADATGHLAKWYVHVPLALGAALVLYRHERKAGAVGVVGTSVGAALLSKILDRVFEHRTPPPGRGDPSVQSYPSGHALEPTAVAIACSYVIAREKLLPSRSAAPLALAALAPVVAGVGRLALDRHWVSDLAGGYAAGIAFGTACAGTYELVRRPRRGWFFREA